MTFNSKQTIVVAAIDFGTSRSGYAYAFRDDNPHFSQINLKAQFRDQKPEFLGLT